MTASTPPLVLRTTQLTESLLPNLPGGNWSVGGDTNFYAFQNLSGGYTPYGPNTSLWLYASNGGGLGGEVTEPISSTGGYTEPTQLTIQAGIQVNQYLGSFWTNGLLGFWSSPGTNPLTGFSGIQYDVYGNLTLWQNGVQGATDAYTGTLSPAAFNTLAFTINTTNGSISDVSFGGNTNYSFTASGFTTAATAYAGLGEVGNNEQNWSNAENFVLTGVSVPEPGTSAMLISGVGLLLGNRRARRS